MWFDSHCHLHLCAEDAAVSDVLERCRAAGVTRIVTVGIDVESSRRAVELAVTDGVFATAGLHPNSSVEWDEDVAADIAALSGDDSVVAIGETGLDYYRDYTPRNVQERVFEAHIELAIATGKPLVIHTRASTSAALDVLASTGYKGGLVFHCWSGDRTELERALEMEAMVSFAGNVSFASAHDLRDAAAAVPEDRLLVETDSPYLTPVPHRGKPNEPRNVVFVGEAVARARDAGSKEIALLTFSNATRFFGLS